ncbi:MAG: DUF5666 domain-containing protein [Acidobacteriota bacterium]
MHRSLSALSALGVKSSQSNPPSDNIRKHATVSVAAILLALAAGCGGGSSSSSTANTRPIAGQSTMVTLIASSTANDQLVQLFLTLKSLTLTAQDGTTTAALIPTPQQVEFIHLNNGGEPLLTVSVPQGVYTKATVATNGGGFVCSAQQQGLNMTAHYTNPAPTSTAVQMPNRIVIDGSTMTLSLELLVSQSATLPSNCYNQGFAGDSLNPTFSLTALTAPLGRPALPALPKLMALEGQVVSPAAGPGSFGVSAADSQLTLVPPNQTWLVQTSASTVFQGIGNTAGLTAGMPVDIDGTVQPDGSIAATRVAVLDPDTTNLTVNIGPLMQVVASAPLLNQVNQLAEGSSQFMRTWPQYNFSNATLALWGGLTNLASLPFPATFTISNFVPGQNVAITTHLTQPGPYPNTPATTVTLMPQTINGTVLSTATAGGFTTYTVQLAAYSMFPQFDTQPGQTTLITNPQQVIVYADANTQINGSGVASNLGLFTGVMFNDNGALRMDAIRIGPGVSL